MPLDHTDLKELKKRGDIEGLLGILDTGDVRECRDAICILGELRNKKAIRPLITLLETDDVQIRANAAWALGEIGNVKAVLPLIALLNDPSDNVRIHAAWSLGRIGDKRAVPGLRAILKNGSTDLRKHAREAIERIESNGNGNRYAYENDETSFSENVDIPLVTLDIPSDLFKCEYLSRVENGETKTDYGNTTRFSNDLMITDTDSNGNGENRKIVLGLKNEFNGLVSVDIILKYNENNGSGMQANSIWLQMENLRKNNPAGRGAPAGEEDLEKEEQIEIKRRTAGNGAKKVQLKPLRKHRPAGYDLSGEAAEDEIVAGEISSVDYDFDYPEENTAKKKEIVRFEKRSRKTPELEEPELEPEAVSVKESVKSEKKIQEPEVKAKVARQETEQVKESVKPDKKSPEPEIKAKVAKPEIEKVKEPIKPEKKLPETEVKARVTEPEVKTSGRKPEVEITETVEPMKAETYAAPAKPEPAAPPKKDQNIDSAVRLLSDIGMSGMTNAASTVTQLSGEEAESSHSLLRTLPIEQMHDEIISLGDSIVMVGIGLHGKGATGEVRGEMQLYISRENALDIANELLCNPPDAACKEFNEDIISTLKETANIFGGQYISAVSEYIEVPLLLNAPTFKTGSSSKIAEAAMKEIEGKVEFALATNLALGMNKTGRLIMLVDPKSFDIIIQKLF
ncbi:MAG: HEAT repeat domain-containing protein [Candidatus Methanoperedens sp.]|nr:HEAT repeat domain-containing protein [Candidatus Methanoperedens sp.]MCZ7404723.1 HEAT repeat domain-containing protein [Candidatus Methanoperedens sp.]